MSTLKVTNIKAADGTSALSIADSTGKVTTADSELNVKAVNGSTTHTFTVKGIGESIGDSQPTVSPDTTDSDSGQIAVYTGATKLLGITEHGYVLKPNNPSFLVKNSPSKSAGNIVYGFGAITNNVGSHYDNSNGRFTAPVNGTYLFHASIWAQTNEDNYLVFDVNGTEQVGGHIDASNPSSGYATMIFQLNAGDYVELKCGYSIQGSSPRNHFSGCLLG